MKRTREDVIGNAIDHLTMLHDNAHDGQYTLSKDEIELVNFLIKQEIDGSVDAYFEDITDGRIINLISTHTRIMELFALIVQ